MMELPFQLMLGVNQTEVGLKYRRCILDGYRVGWKSDDQDLGGIGVSSD